MAKKPVSVLTPDECDRFLTCAANQSDLVASSGRRTRNYLAAVLMLDAGLRVGEMVKLRVFDLWYHGAPVNSLLLRAQITKNGINRSVPTTDRLRSAIMPHIRRSCSLPDDHGATYVFPSPTNLSFLSVRAVEKFIGLIGYASIGRQVRPHELRHTFATRLMDKCNLRVVQELLGHKNISTTQIYTHPNSQHLRDAIDKL